MQNQHFIKNMTAQKFTLTMVMMVWHICATTAQNLDKNLDNSLTKIYKESNFPGFAISIIKGDSTLFAKSYGYANKATKTPYSLETIQPIGSVSKTFIGLALMKCIELGYFTLETDINQLLPFKIVHPSFPNSVITVKQLATHTSSLIDNDSIYYNYAYQLGEQPTVPLGSFLSDYYTKDGKFYSPTNFGNQTAGTSYAYSNIASALMAYIIEVQANMSFASFTEKYIFKPLQMNQSHWFYKAQLSKQYATLYQVNEVESLLEEKIINADKSLQSYSCITYPDGSLRTSVNDLAIYLKAMMKGYFKIDSTILSQPSYHTLFAKQFSEDAMPSNMDTKEPNRGIFWAYSKKGSIRHTGSDPGVFCFISFNPITKVGTVMTINTSLEGGENHKTVGYFMKVIAALENFEKSLT